MARRFAQFGMKLVAAAREYHPGGPGRPLEIAISILGLRFVAEESRSHKAYGDLPFNVMMSFLSTSSRFRTVGDDSGYSGPATPEPFHLFDRPNYDLDSSLVTLSSSAHLEIQPKYWLQGSLVTIGLRSLA